MEAGVIEGVSVPQAVPSQSLQLRPTSGSVAHPEKAIIMIPRKINALEEGPCVRRAGLFAASGTHISFGDLPFHSLRVGPRLPFGPQERGFHLYDDLCFAGAP